jgi:plasmid stabilization system protein ParE
MRSTVLYKRAARAEISDIAEYLERQRPGLGRRFMDEIRRAEVLVRDNPALYQQVTGDIRRIVLRRFPYRLFYAVEDERIFVLACFHLRRRPRFREELLAR